MHISISCNATFDLLQCNKEIYLCFQRFTLSFPTAQGVHHRRKEISMLLSLIRMIQAFRDYQRNVSELSQLSDRELADIGLDRSDIPRVAAGHAA